MLEASEKFRVALQEFLGPTATGGQPALDLDALAKELATQLGTGRQLVQVTPLEALRHQFQQETVDRLVAQINALDGRPRRAILWLLSVGTPAHHRRICDALGFPIAGGSFVKFGTGIKEAVAAGFLTDGEKGLRVTLYEKVTSDLSPYDPTPEDTEATYQQLVAALAKAPGDS